MTDDHTQTMESLVKKLNHISSVRRYDREGESEAERLAHALYDMKGSFEVYLNKLFPALLEAKSEKEISNILQDICHEIGHIQYHINDSSYISSFMGLYNSKNDA